MQDTFWIDVVKALIGTFIGAALAFGFAILIQELQRRRERRHAGFEATFELARMIQAFANLRQSFLSDPDAQMKRAPGLPPALVSRPSIFRMDMDIGLHLESLSFLLDGSVVVLNDRHLRRVVARYLDYYHDWRTHLSLSMDAPNSRMVHPPDRGRVVAFPELGGLHHHYERLAA